MKATIISNEKLHDMFGLEESGLCDMHWVKEAEFKGLRYAVYEDRKAHKNYAARVARSVSFGLNSIPAGKEAEFVSIMEREGRCEARWGCTGRTLHQMLARQLEAKHPEYRFEIGYNYECRAFADHVMVTMPELESEVDI